MEKGHNCALVLGPTASGKTKLAVELASQLNGAIFSLDSRQVYKQLDIGTGKDLYEFQVGEKQIPYYLINIAELEENYNLSRFLSDFETAWIDAQTKGLFPILCGGTGLYMDALMQDHEYVNIPANLALRERLEPLEHKELLLEFEKHNARFPKVDTHNKRRLIRAIEIGVYLKGNPLPPSEKTVQPKPFTIGIDIPVEERRSRITDRLQHRLKNGLVEEVDVLLKSGVSKEWLLSLGLEYKFVTQHLLGQLSYTEMQGQLLTAIHQFAKRQMAWFRKLEREGLDIRWLSPLSHWRGDGGEAITDILSELD